MISQSELIGLINKKRAYSILYIRWEHGVSNDTVNRAYLVLIDKNASKFIVRQNFLKYICTNFNYSRKSSSLLLNTRQSRRLYSAENLFCRWRRRSTCLKMSHLSPAARKTKMRTFAWARFSTGRRHRHRRRRRTSHVVRRTSFVPARTAQAGTHISRRDVSSACRRRRPQSELTSDIAGY